MNKKLKEEIQKWITEQDEYWQTCGIQRQLDDDDYIGKAYNLLLECLEAENK